MKVNKDMMKQLVYSIVFMSAFVLFSCNEDATPDIDNPSIVNPPSGSSSFSVIEDDFEGVPIIVVGSGRKNIIAVFNRAFAGGLRIFTPLNNALPIVMEDDLGNQWDAFGLARLGPNQGETLTPINSGMGYWFAFSAFYPGVEIYGEVLAADIEVAADTSDAWGVPDAYVAQGAGFDGIPAVDEPKFTTFNLLETDPSNPFHVDQDDLIIGVNINGVAKAYPHSILDWHEIVNDEVGGVPIAVTYCPLTGTARVWKRDDESVNNRFGVSGFLYNSNIIAFDRGTESLWSQLEAICIFGTQIGQRLEILPYVETTWETWQSIQSSPLVLSEDTGFNRNYTQFPYGDYRTSNLVAYPLLYNDERLHKKERVFGVIINGKAKAYRLSDF